MAATYTQNRLPKSVRHDTSPYELLWKKKPSLGHMRVFGSRGYVYVESSRRKKFDAKAHRCIFLGYAEGSKAYRVWDSDTQILVVT